jgi:hypothetical protein
VKIVRPGSVYRPISSLSFYESDYVASVLHIRNDIFPGFFCGPFTPLVESEHGTSRPDLVLVDERYRNWFVVEVELEHHSLSGHVEPQIRRLANGVYTDVHAEALFNALPGTSLTDLTRLVRSTQPGVVVIVPELRASWMPSLKALGATLVVLQVLEDGEGNRLYKIEGEEVEGYESHVIGVAQRTPAIRIALSVSGLAAEELGSELDLLFEDEMTRWKVVRTGSDILLLPLGRCPLPEQLTESYIISSTDSGVWRLVSRGN